MKAAIGSMLTLLFVIVCLDVYAEACTAEPFLRGYLAVAVHAMAFIAAIIGGAMLRGEE